MSPEENMITNLLPCPICHINPIIYRVEVNPNNTEVYGHYYQEQFVCPRCKFGLGKNDIITGPGISNETSEWFHDFILTKWNENSNNSIEIFHALIRKHN